jgi:hypothetical protein
VAIDEMAFRGDQPFGPAGQSLGGGGDLQLLAQGKHRRLLESVPNLGTPEAIGEVFFALGYRPS